LIDHLFDPALSRLQLVAYRNAAIRVIINGVGFAWSVFLCALPMFVTIYLLDRLGIIAP